LNPGPDFEFPPPSDIDALLDGTPVPVGEITERTWRPTCERYPEFMAEQWALDQVEEEEARVEAARNTANEKVEAAKRAERNKKRQQAEARKRAKLAAAEQQQRGTPVVEDEWSTSSLGMVGLGQPSPSPLRHGTTYAYDGDGDVENSYSPAPTPASNGEFQGGQSGYNSDNLEAEIENGEEQCATRALSHDVPAMYSAFRSPRETNS